MSGKVFVGEDEEEDSDLEDINLDDFPKEFHNDWKPSKEDTDILRERLIWKIEQKPNQWRYMSNYIQDIVRLKDTIKNGEVYKV